LGETSGELVGGMIGRTCTLLRRHQIRADEWKPLIQRWNQARCKTCNDIGL
jgi:hypothetical protein